MRKALLAISILVATGTATAEYTAKIPLEQAQGGSLPNGSITFTNQEPTTPTAPILDCVNNPEENPTECQERLTAWEAFADARGLSKDWTSLDWLAKDLTTIPTEPYPLTSVDFIDLSGNQLTNVDGLSNLTSVNFIYLNNNKLTNVDGLSNLTSASDLQLSSNQLTNVDWLSNLTSVDDLQLSSNQLTNINGLSNLTSVDNLNLDDNNLTNVDGLSNLTSANLLYLEDNQLTNINGLANLEIMTNISIDATYAGPKLAATTRFCSLNSPDKFAVGYSQKTQLCESP